ncbi:MAG: thiamine phosphate synthase [Ghiorsea sp.]|nr:thiamine phosphate synthase [Ghiorsea sp.]
MTTTNLMYIRKDVSDDFIVGITARADAQYAKAAISHGANYVSFGAVFESQTKADVPVIGLPRLTKACSMFPNTPICAIGGITMDNIVMIKAAGASYAAVISSLFDGTAVEIQNNATNMVTLWNSAPSA